MTIGLLKEGGTEKRVVMLPAEVAILKKMVAEVIIEHDAGAGAFVSDEDYKAAGAVVSDRGNVLSISDMLLSVNPVPPDDLNFLGEGKILCSTVNLVSNFTWLEKARLQGLSVLALELVPRITRAQSMDTLSSMATVTGYKAVLAAASALPKFFPMFMSAAGTVKPAKVLILGAGVAGLEAVSVARRLGAVVEVFDVRSAVRDEVKSLGARFIEVEGAAEDQSAGGYAVQQTEEYRSRQKELIRMHSINSDVIITTAQIPGRKAPLLIPGETVMAMKPGSVIVDIAASSGGNCELTVNNETVTVNGITIIGRSDFPSDMPSDASKMFGANVTNLLKIIIDAEGNPCLDMNNEIVAGTLAVHNREYVSQAVKNSLRIK